MKVHGNAARRKKRLQLFLFLFFLLFAVPILFLLDTVYRQLQNEAFYRAKQQAERLSDRIEALLQDTIAGEQLRPSAEYSFFNVLENPLLDSAGVKFSPLSEIPPNTGIPGLVGYFQIEPDGSFHIPSLPELGSDSDTGLSRTELKTRLALKRRLQRLLAKETEAQEITGSLARPSADTDEIRQYVLEQPEMGDLDEKAASRATAAHSLASQRRDFAKARLKQTRKEQVQLPDQAMASSYFQRASPPSVAESLPAPAPARREADTGSGGAVEIISFESEITPLQLMIVKQRYFCFYRHVWHDNSRYTQGFLVAIDEFFDAAAEPVVGASPVDRVELKHQGQLLASLRVSAADAPTPLYSRQLNAPFERLELQVHGALTADSESSLVDLLAAAIGLTLIAGLLFFYRLLARQIELSQQQQNFISAVSHELKTPLTSIRLYGEILRSGWADENKKRQYYDFIFFESERLSRLIGNVLQLARIDHRNHRPELTAKAATALLQSIPARIETQIAAAGFRLNLIEPGDSQAPLAVAVDEDAFFQIVINLVDNALKFAAGADDKIIDIGYRPTTKRNRVEFYVRDYGPGIDGNQQRKIFRLFYRPGDELTRSTPGTGIGLALSAQLAESMKSQLAVVNRQPGAEFQIRFTTVPLSES